jgi:RNA processing factor Prp31
MAHERTPLSRYKSPSTGEYCTGAQYISEMMCQRMAENNNEGSLAYKFWNTKKWQKTYQLQIIVANRLTDKYDERAIITALRSKEGKKIYSLRFPNIEELIERHESLINKGEGKTISTEPNSAEAKPRKPFGEKSKIQKLRDLDG